MSPGPGAGITARSRAGAFGGHMWSRRWTADLESGVSRTEAYLGRSDAREDKVLSLEHSGRIVRCDVAGSRPLPFTVEFLFAPLDHSDSESLREALRREEHGILGALAGDFSDTVGFLLLPAVDGATSYTCHCPVQPGPCRHVLAAANIMVEWWDASPSVMFELRGLSADTLGILLRGDGAGESGGVDVDMAESLWGSDPLLPSVPSPAPAGLEDLLDAPVTRRMAAAATNDPLEQLRVVADLEDFLDAFGHYGAP
ncbi:hypothetical protein NCCP2495_03910 [Dietzia sp. NCCP-2495]|uniref:hypothetical protein n=1 Tax=Dietzia sp. NCCP-2495 TaxID=2934675 RepID=UPI00223267B8|nr:hypothetical protein [Dietzia sp. NCCP-2495]GLB62513.1 hypothetical protein NCCP2495_03910 [Dietzia sp. NCCP-2495]